MTNTPKTKIIVCCGTGGVGKTTTSAALSLSLAAQGARVVTITIDPAKRLADALALEHLSGEPTPVPVGRLFDTHNSDVTTPNGGSLDAMMLDVKTTFDEVVVRHAPDQATSDRLLASRYYELVSEKLAGSAEYMAIEQLYKLYSDYNYDVIVVDTPPSVNAVDFLTAPERLSAMMSDSVIRWMSAPKSPRGMRLFERGSRTIMTVMKKMIGQTTVTEIAEFFELISGLAEGFRTRSGEMISLLKSPCTSFLLVTSPASSAVDDTIVFRNQLQSEGFPLGGVVVNRVTPTLTNVDAVSLEETLARGEIDLSTTQRRLVAKQLLELQRNQNQQAEADNLVAEDMSKLSPTWAIPTINVDISELSSLFTLSTSLNEAAEALTPHLFRIQR